MACNSGYCKSGCYGVGDGDENRRPATQNNEPSNSASPGGGDSEPSTNCNALCVKCKVNETISPSYPYIAGGGDVRRFCIDCFRGNLFGKFRFAVTSNAMILPSDNLLVAFSGGASSRVALEFVHKMHQKAQKNFDASRDRSLPVFGVGVAFIDERASFAFPSNDFDRAINDMSLIVSSLTPPEKQFHVVRTETIFSPNCAAGRAKLTEVITAIGDVTGKEDFLEYLRMLSLQKIAVENGYTKLVLGTCTSRIACHVLEATVKGQGFSLAADIQYADARWEIPVVLPLRDCLSEELNMLCSLDSLKTEEALRQPRSGINGLISAFVKLLKENIAIEVEIRHLKDLTTAMILAQLYERRLVILQAKPKRTVPRTNLLAMRPTLIKQLSRSEMEEWRAHGLYFNIDKLFAPGHPCKWWFRLEVVEDNTLDDKNNGQSLDEFGCLSFCGYDFYQLQSRDDDGRMMMSYRFIQGIKDENPLRESTIVRTAGKLTPFCFNTVPEVDDCKGHLADQRRHKKYNLKFNESLPPESLCLICRSPLMKSDFTALNGFVDAGPITEILLATCSSCQYQILPKDPSSLEYFRSLLPQSMTSLVKNNCNNQKRLREQIQDCLLSD